MRARKITVGLVLAISLCAGLTGARGQELVTIGTRAGVTQAYLLDAPSHPPHAAAVLFPGGGGNIRLREQGGRIRFSPNNFLVRSRGEFVQRGIAIAMVDAPSDRQSGMDDAFRSGNTHRNDVQAVVSDLARRFPAIPVFLVGTSRGTVSAAYLGRAFGHTVAGVVLTAAVYLPSGKRALSDGHGLSEFDFSSIKSPLLLVHHRDDGCRLTPYHAAQRLADRFPLVSVSGGKPAISPPCAALSEHGFLGREPATVEAIVNWMLKRPYASEIN